MVEIPGDKREIEIEIGLVKKGTRVCVDYRFKAFNFQTP